MRSVVTHWRHVTLTSVPSIWCQKQGTLHPYSAQAPSVILQTNTLVATRRPRVTRTVVQSITEQSQTSTTSCAWGAAALTRICTRAALVRTDAVRCSAQSEQNSDLMRVTSYAATDLVTSQMSRCAVSVTGRARLTIVHMVWHTKKGKTVRLQFARALHARMTMKPRVVDLPRLANPTFARLIIYPDQTRLSPSVRGRSARPKTSTLVVHHRALAAVSNARPAMLTDTMLRRYSAGDLDATTTQTLFVVPGRMSAIVTLVQQVLSAGPTHGT